MNAKRYFLVSGVIFGAIAVVHLFRILRGWSFMIGDFSAPISISIGGVVFFALLSIWAFRLRSA